MLLWCATPESVVRKNKLDEQEREKCKENYYERQEHGSLISFLQVRLGKERCPKLFAQVGLYCQ